MSPYLFILSLEALAQMIREESRRKRLQLPIRVVSLLLRFHRLDFLAARVHPRGSCAGTRAGRMFPLVRFFI